MSEATQVVRKGELSPALATKLKTAGKAVTDKTVSDMIACAEGCRVSYQATSLMLGITLLAKQQGLGARKFKPWVDSLSGQSSAHIASKSFRTIKIYMQLARRFLAQLEQGDFNDEIRQKELNAFTPDQIVQAKQLGSKSFAKNLEEFIGGRSLDQMLKDFASARLDALAEPDKSDTRVTAGQGGPGGAKAAQFDFFETLNSDFQEGYEALDSIVERPYWLDTSVTAKEKLEGIEQMRRKIAAVDQKLKDKQSEIAKGAAA